MMGSLNLYDHSFKGITNKNIQLQKLSTQRCSRGNVPVAG